MDKIITNTSIIDHLPLGYERACVKGWMGGGGGLARRSVTGAGECMESVKQSRARPGASSQVKAEGVG